MKSPDEGPKTKHDPQKQKAATDELETVVKRNSNPTTSEEELKPKTSSGEEVPDLLTSGAVDKILPKKVGVLKTPTVNSSATGKCILDCDWDKLEDYRGGRARDPILQRCDESVDRSREVPVLKKRKLTRQL